MEAKNYCPWFKGTTGLFNKLGLAPSIGRYLAALFIFSYGTAFGQGYPTFSISESGGTINVSAYGAYPDDGIDDEDEIQAAIDAAGNNTVVVFAAGTYNFSAPDDSSRASTLTGAEAHIRVSGKTNITLRGAVDGTTGEPTTIFDRDLLFYPNQSISGSYDRVSILDARNNSGVKIENVAFKNKLHYTVGKVLSINSTTITVEIVDGYPVEGGCPVASANVWTWDEVNEGEEILKIGEPSVTYGDNAGHYFTVLDAGARTMQCVKTGNAFYGKASVGDYVSWHYGWNARGTVYLTGNTNVHLENVHIYTALRSALFISYNHNLYFNELEIRPENDRFSMSPRDGVHASRNTGEFVSENMYIKGARLDGYVVTGTAADVYSLTDSRNFQYLTDQSVGSFNSTNEPMYFYDDNVRHKVEVQSASYVSHSSAGSIYSVVTSEDIPSFVNTSTNLVPGGLSPDTVIVRNSTFKSIGGASELYFCDNVFSSNNYHENIMYSPVRLGANPSRNHTGGNLTFSGNEYVDCAWEGNYYKSNQYGYISAFNISNDFSNMYLTNLVIEDNEFTSTTSATNLPPIELDEVGNALIRNNTYNGFSQFVKLWDVYNVTNEDADSVYRLKNKDFGNFLRGYDPTSSNTSGDHANVTHEALNTTSPDQQSWEFSPVSTQLGYYYIRNIDSNRALRAYDVNNSPTSGDGVPVTVYPVTAWGSMMWKPIPVSGDSNTYFLKSFSGGYFLKGASVNASYATLETDSTSTGTQWVLYDLSGPLPDTTTSTSYIIAPSADAYVKGGTDANNNYGTAATLAIKESSNANYDRMSFLKFDLSGISGTVSTATIRLKVSADDAGASHSLHSVATDTWTESGITWNNKPSASSLISTQAVPSASGWIVFDVTSLVNNETDGTLSVQVSDANAAEHYVQYHSLEATNTDDRPQLVYQLSTTPDPLVPTADAYVKGGTDANNNFGTATALGIKESSNANYDRMSFLKFDLSPISGAVSTATIRLKVSADDAGASHSLHSVATDSWTESGITWNNKPSASSLISTQTVPSAGGWIEFDVTSLVNNETDGILSLRVSDANAAEHYVLYHSKETSNAEDRPQLEYALDTSSSRLLTSNNIEAEDMVDNKGAFTFYPNPARDQINIVGSGLNGAIVELTDLSGKSVLKTRLTEDTSSILKLKQVENGVYFFKITKLGGEIISRKLIVE